MAYAPVEGKACGGSCGKWVSGYLKKKNDEAIEAQDNQTSQLLDMLQEQYCGGVNVTGCGGDVTNTYMAIVDPQALHQSLGTKLVVGLMLGVTLGVPGALAMGIPACAHGDVTACLGLLVGPMIPAGAEVDGMLDDTFLDTLDEDLGSTGSSLHLMAGSDATVDDFIQSIKADSDELASEPMSCFTNSFTPDTPVLLADGTTKPIKNIKIGDKVEATDPVTDKTQSEPVTQLHDNQDTDLTDLLVQTPTGLAIIHTTQGHLFWNRTAKHWTPASSLTPQTVLQTDDGTLVTVIYASNWSGSQDMRNLTVAQIHTYYVMAGSTPVLVHNCGVDDVAQNIADHANGEALRPNGDGTHFVRGVDSKALPYYVDGVINGEVPNVEVRYLNNGRVGYWDPDKGSVIIEDGDGGTVFTPKDGYSYFQGLK